MLLVPFVTLETMIIVHTGFKPASIIHSTTTTRWQTLGSPSTSSNTDALASAEDEFENIQGACAKLGITAHMSILFWAFHDLLRPKFNMDGKFEGFLGSGLGFFWTETRCMWATPVVLMYIGVPTFFSWLLIIDTPDTGRLRGPILYIAYTPFVCSLSGLSFFMSSIWSQAGLEFATEMFYHVVLFGLLFGALERCLRLLTVGEDEVCTAIWRKVLLTEDDDAQGNANARRVWVMFFLTTLVTFLWYDFRYDPTYTDKPPLTDSFG